MYYTIKVKAPLVFESPNEWACHGAGFENVTYDYVYSRSTKYGSITSSLYYPW